MKNQTIDNMTEEDITTEEDLGNNTTNVAALTELKKADAMKALENTKNSWGRAYAQ